nr:hypothetical protein CFP56_15347 [Quercus suber]
MARWDKVNCLKVENVRLSLELAGGEGFLWRPYAMAMGGWKFPNFYSEKEIWVPVGPVAMQFSMDQDLPDFVPRLNEFLDIAWNDYSKPISDEKLYIPPRLFKAGITASGQELEIPGLALEKRIIRLEKVIAELKAARFGSKFSKKSKKGHSST